MVRRTWRLLRKLVRGKPPPSNADLNARECQGLPITVKSKPILIYAELSTRCNLACRMCGRFVTGVKLLSELQPLWGYRRT